MRTLIVDDVKLSRQGLSDLLETYYPECDIIGSVPSVALAKKILSEQKVQLLFLDVQLSDGIGFEILDNVEPMTKVVFLTAYENYAIEAVRQGAFDYLLKPLNVDDLRKCISRLRDEDIIDQGEEVELEEFQAQPLFGRIGISSIDGIDYFDTDDILFLRAFGKYTEITTREGMLLSSKNLKHFEIVLAENNFIRIHNSYLVNLKYIRKFKREDTSILLKNNIEIPVSKAKKEVLMKRLITV